MKDAVVRAVTVVISVLALLVSVLALVNTYSISAATIRANRLATLQNFVANFAIDGDITFDWNKYGGQQGINRFLDGQHAGLQDLCDEYPDFQKALTTFQMRVADTQRLIPKTTNYMNDPTWLDEVKKDREELLREISNIEKPWTSF